MLGATVACPKCSGTLPLTTWTPGRQLRCPRCAAIFRLGARPGLVGLVEPTPTPQAQVPAPSGQPRTSLDQRRRMLLGAALGGVLFFVVGTISLAVYVARVEKPTEQPEAQNSERDSKESPRHTPTSGSPTVSHPVAPPMPMPVEPPAPVRRLPPELQTAVDAAIDKGLAFLKSQNVRDEGGSGFLYALTLLECGVTIDDPRLARLVTVIRDYARSPRAVQTYEITLAALFLDRLRDPADKPLIRSLGLRLLAGQQPDGGWTYFCPYLSPEVEDVLLAALETSRPQLADELMYRDGTGQVIELDGKFVKEDRLEPHSIKNLETARNKLASVQTALDKHPQLKRIPSLQAIGELTPTPRRPGGVRPALQTFGGVGTSDNSNTQFAALGLWAASRCALPCERGLALLSARFRTSQRPTGSWGYRSTNGETPAMTCAGLLALAIGHGIRLEDTERKRDDPQIQSGLDYLAKNLVKGDALSRNLYFMWSLERVGVLFNLDSVGTIDWYEWGAKRLTATQTGDGSWYMNGYHGSSKVHDTCFALLFLKKANFVSDLSNKLNRVLDIKGTRRGEQP